MALEVERVNLCCRNVSQQAMIDLIPAGLIFVKNHLKLL